MRKIRNISEREIAINLVLELAESGRRYFSMMEFYDNDIDFINDLADRLQVKNDKPFKSKLTRVVRRMVRYGVLSGQIRGTHSEYLGEPRKQMDYSFASPGKDRLLTSGPTEHIGPPEWEASFLLRRAYPADET